MIFAALLRRLHECEQHLQGRLAPFAIGELRPALGDRLVESTQLAGAIQKWRASKFLAALLGVEIQPVGRLTMSPLSQLTRVKRKNGWRRARTLAPFGARWLGVLGCRAHRTLD